MPNLTPQSIERLRELQEVCREDAELLKRHDEYAKDWRDFADALAAAVAVVEKLPVTADGVVVTPGMRYWFEYEDAPGEYGSGFASEIENEKFMTDFSDCYSSKTVAQAAKEQTDDSQTRS